jgi:uncharacterized RDD family membrane protein YckC
MLSQPAATAATPAPGQPAWSALPDAARPPLLQPLPVEIKLAGIGRRLAGYLLDGLLVIVTLFIGWLIWSIVVWGRGQSPGKQILGMRVLRTDRLVASGRLNMFGRFLAMWLIAIVASVTFVGYVLYFWLCWDRDRQELWDKMASTIVVRDASGLLDPNRAPARPAA